ncbi:MAG TPA: hypothetical protein VNL77_14310 [Roseiflexaceae bacterium]|nr:hypothetical protein [Roseiflexaceae bacterium]
MTLDFRNLRRFDPHASQQAARDGADPSRPPLDRDIALIGVGNSGEAVTLRCQAIAMNDGVTWPAVGLNNDRLAPRPLVARRADGTPQPLGLTDRLVLGGEHPRERMQDYPLLRERYRRLLRGISVFETHPRAGDGGHGYPQIAALDIDLHINEVLRLLRRVLRPAAEESAVGRSELQQLLARRQRGQEAPREKRIVIVGGACGAMGNAAHHLLPYLCRHLLAEQHVTSYQLIGVLLGPRIFTGLTPFVRYNGRALLQAIEHMSRDGQQRAYINDLTIDSQQPPYDRVFLIDDPTLPGGGERPTEAELERFLDRAALSLALLLRSNVWQTFASHTANHSGPLCADGRIRYLHTVQSALVGADRAHLADLLATTIACRVSEQALRRLEAA